MSGTPQQIVEFAPPGTTAQQFVAVSNPEDFALVTDWAPSTLYLVGNPVIDATNSPKILYRANTEHTSGATFLADITNWDVVGGAGALDAKDSVRVATTSNIALTGSPTVDGISDLADGQRVLAAGQTTTGEIGSYIVNTGGAWTRSNDFQAGDNVAGARFFVYDGTANIGKIFSVANIPGSDVVGTDVLTFTTNLATGGAGGTITWIRNTKVDTDYQILLADNGTTIVMDSSTARTATLIATAGDPEFTIRVVKKDAGALTIDVENSSDVIQDQTAGEGIENTTAEIGASVTFQLIGPNLWAIISRDGTWISTAPPAPTITNGYHTGGHSGAGFTSNVQKWALATPGNAVLSPNGLTLTLPSIEGTGHQSPIDGFHCGGTPGGATIQAGVDRWSFASDVKASSPYNLGVTTIHDATRKRKDGAPVSSLTDGFILGGDNGGGKATIVKFDFISGAASNDTGTLTAGTRFASGSQSITNSEGFIVGGINNSAVRQTKIEKHSFTTGASASTVANLATAINAPVGASSSIDGFSMAGITTVLVSTIVRFDFATVTINNSYGNITTATRLGGGVSGTNDAFYSGGLSPSNSFVIEFFDYLTFAGMTTQGTLAVATESSSGVSAQ